MGSATSQGKPEAAIGNDPSGGLVEVEEVSKRYGAVLALDRASMTVRSGQIRGLVGSNGAGKSTLLKVLTGAVRPDSGEVRIRGQRVRLGDPQTTLAAGLSCIYQHGNLAPAMTVGDNIVAGRGAAPKTLRSRARRIAHAGSVLDRFGINLDLSAPVESLGTVDRKFVEIAKALFREPDALLMDEPTAWLSRHDADRLHQTTKTLANEGVAIIYVSHFLDDVLELVDDITVLRDGRVVLDQPNSGLARSDLVKAMLGDAPAAASPRPQPGAKPTPTETPLLSCHSLTRYGEFSDVSLSLSRGEILCVTGLVGSGRTELVECIYGARTPDSGSILIGGTEATIDSPAAAIRQSIALVPEDRHASGLMLPMTIRQNLILTSLRDLTSGGVLSTRRITNQAHQLIDTIGIVPPNPNQLVGNLSGGNQQKTLIARAVGSGADVLLLDEPTVGVDVGAKVEIYAALRRLASDGKGVIVVSTDLEEVEEIADRVVVMRAGTVVAEYSSDEVTHETLVGAISGEAVSR